MMQPQVPHSYLQEDLEYQSELYGYHACDDQDFYSIITPDQDSSIVSSDLYFQTMLPSDACKLSYFSDHKQFVLPLANNIQHVEEIEEHLDTVLDDVLKWWVESEDLDDISTDFSMENEGVCGSPFVKSIDMMLPLEDIEVEGQTRFYSLLKAYGEAMDMGHQKLANVIVCCINAKASPFGGAMERVACNLFQSGTQVDYIKHESMKNFKSAFRAFYEILPYGRFSHFAANSVILEAVMSYSGKLHIIDFDIGEGVQWPALLETIGKQKREIKLTSIRTSAPSYDFDETKNRIYEYANRCGLKLEVQEIKMDDLVSEIEESRVHEFLAFNCMVGLPHMGRTRTRSDVMQFVRTAKNLLLTNKGIITFGDGEDSKRRKDCRGFGSFFDDYIMHYHAVCESMERSFPKDLTEARLAMESLFVWPYVSSWCQKWENDRGNYEIKENIGLMGWRMSKESVMEAKEMVNDRLSSYNIKVEAQNNNEMVLEWKGTPLVRVSAWTSLC
ncbi:hypothetical protein R6Q57_009618 [Mikania cordata]